MLRNNKFRIMLTVIVIVLMLSVTAFASTMFTVPFEGGLGSAQGEVIVSDPYFARAYSTIDFWVGPAIGTRDVTLKFYTWDYSVTQGWHWEEHESNEYSVNSAATRHIISYGDYWVPSKWCIYTIEVEGNVSNIDGWLKYSDPTQ